MLERLTDPARRAISRSIVEARELGHSYAGTEHLLLAILRDNDCVGRQIMVGAGIKPDVLRQTIVDLISQEVGNV